MKCSIGCYKFEFRDLLTVLSTNTFQDKHAHTLSLLCQYRIITTQQASIFVPDTFEEISNAYNMFQLNVQPIKVR
mgnify:CR=1 FL=1